MKSQIEFSVTLHRFITAMLCPVFTLCFMFNAARVMAEDKEKYKEYDYDFDFVVIGDSDILQAGKPVPAYITPILKPVEGGNPRNDRLSAIPRLRFIHVQANQDSEPLTIWPEWNEQMKSQKDGIFGLLGGKPAPKVVAENLSAKLATGKMELPEDFNKNLISSQSDPRSNLGNLLDRLSKQSSSPTLILFYLPQDKASHYAGNKINIASSAYTVYSDAKDLIVDIKKFLLEPKKILEKPRIFIVVSILRESKLSTTAEEQEVSESIRMEIHKLQQEIATLRERDTALVMRAAELADTAAREEVRIAALVKQLTVWQETAPQVETQTKELAAQGPKLVERIVAVQQSVTDSMEIAHLARELQEINASTKGLQLEIAALVKASAATTPNAWLIEVDQVRNSSSSLTTQARNLQEIGAKLAAETTELAAHVTTLAASVVGGKAKPLEIKNQAKGYRASMQSLTPRLDEFATALQTLEAQATGLSAKLDGVEPRAAELSQNGAELQKRVAALETTLSKRMAELEAKLQELGIPPCLLSKPVPLKHMLPMALVAKRTGETVPGGLHKYMKGQINKPLYEHPFYIMRREVQVWEFRQYVENLDTSKRAQLESKWLQDKNGLHYPDSNPVASVPWGAANDYADWLARETGCPLRLPTYNQWVAAAWQYAQSEQVVLRRDEHNPTVQQRAKLPPPSTVVDLLGNLREWATDSSGPWPCLEGGHYTLGEDYQTYPRLIAGEPRCVSQTLPTIGFRLVMPMTTSR
jgi:formylglycine-generating enzyme required for sulfatase activity